MIEVTSDDAVLAWQRARFMQLHADATLPELVAIIRTACKEGQGIWQEPTPVTGGLSSTARPATHLYEIHFLGLSAVGATPDEAVRNWRGMVQRETGAAA